MGLLILKSPLTDSVRSMIIPSIAKIKEKYQGIGFCGISAQENRFRNFLKYAFCQFPILKILARKPINP
jgi:hypothetical protein